MIHKTSEHHDFYKIIATFSLQDHVRDRIGPLYRPATRAWRRSSGSGGTGALPFKRFDQLRSLHAGVKAWAGPGSPRPFEWIGLPILIA